MNEEQLNQIAQVAFEEIISMRDTPVVSTAQLKKELSQIDKKQERLRDLYIDGNMSKEMLDDKNGELARRRYQIEDELEKRKNIFDAEDITPEDIKEFIVQYVEDVQNDYEQSDDEFKRIMINTFVERVDVSKEKVTVHIHTPFSRMDRGYNGNFTGVLHRLSTVKLQRSFPRKKNIHGRLD